MKVDIAFQTQMAEHGSSEGFVNAMLMQTTLKETHSADTMV